MKDILKGIVYVGLFAVPFLTLYVANENFFPYITGKKLLVSNYCRGRICGVCCSVYTR
jgi:hypothetical protein